MGNGEYNGDDSTVMYDTDMNPTTIYMSTKQAIAEDKSQCRRQ